MNKDDDLSKEALFVDKVAALAAQAAKGSHTSYIALVHLIQQPLFRRVYVVLEEQEEAEDVVQEVLIQAWRSLSGLRDPQAAWAWICQMAFNITRDHRRKRKRKKREEPLSISAETQAFLEVWSSAENITPESQMISAELLLLVKRAIDQLGEKYSEVLRLREFGEFSYQEISEMLGCSISAVESRIHRARIKLKHKLKQSLKELRGGGER